MMNRYVLSVASLALLATSCVPTAIHRLRHHYFHKTEQPHAAEWGYEGAGAPEHWGDLSPDYHLAKDGREQSPIDVHATATAALPALEFDYRPALIRMVYNGHSVQENEDGDSHLTVEGKRYKLEQFHFHSPSEHTVDGKSFAMELHFVHEGEDGEVAVVSVLIDEGAHNAAFDAMWADLPDRDDPKENSSKRIGVAELLPKDRRYYAYRGSFTTPPCTEGVRWFVMQQPVQLSNAQIATFRKVIYHNNRPVQPLNGRAVTVSR